MTRVLAGVGCGVLTTAVTFCSTSAVRANSQYLPLMVSLSNHEQERSSFDGLRTSGVLNRRTHDTSGEAEAALDKRVAAFSKQIRCLVCQNETLADSQAALAVDLRREIREQMKGGRSDEQITQFLTERYGDFVRYRPPLTLKTYPLWFGPFILLAGVLVTLYRGVTRSPAPAERRSLSATERERARRLLNGRPPR